MTPRVPSLLLLSLTVELFSLSSNIGRLGFLAVKASVLGESREALESAESPHGVVAGADAQEVEAFPPVQEFCQGPEDVRACDYVRDGVCIISPASVRLRQRLRWREGGALTSRPLEPRWVDGLTIRTVGDIEVRGATIQCTQAAPLWGRSAGRMLRLRTRRPRLIPRKRTAFEKGLKDGNVGPQRIELCASGSIRLLGNSKLHCEEAILFAGDFVSVAETAEITASGTITARSPSPVSKEVGASHPAYKGASVGAGGASTEAIAAQLKEILSVGQGRGQTDVALGKRTPPKDEVSGSSSATFPDTGFKGTSEKGFSGLLNQDHELRGGSYGGLGGVASDRCEAKAFSRTPF